MLKKNAQSKVHKSKPKHKDDELESATKLSTVDTKIHCKLSDIPKIIPLSVFCNRNKNKKRATGDTMSSLNEGSEEKTKKNYKKTDSGKKSKPLVALATGDTNSSLNGHERRKESSLTVVSSGGITEPKLTPKERTIWLMSQVKFMTNKEIAERLECTERNVQNHLSNIKKKGLFSFSSQGKSETAVLDDPTPDHSEENQRKLQSEPMWGYHGIQIHINIPPIADEFQKRAGIPFSLDGHTVVLGENTCDIYIKEYRFYGKTVDEAIAKFYFYLPRLLDKVQNSVRAPFLKEGKMNIQIVDGELAREHDPIAEALHESGQRIIIRAKDGKIRAWTDASNFPEIELIHAKLHKPDAKAIEAYYQDILEGNATRPAETKNQLEAHHQILKKVVQDIRELKTISKKEDYDPMFG